jgi:hypothetical protein
MRPRNELRDARVTGSRRTVAVIALALLVALVLNLFPRVARASDQGLSTCDGPAACCPASVSLDIQGRHVVEVGAVLLAITDVSEKSSTWGADYYSYEFWDPSPGFVPQTDVVNEVERKSTQFDTTEIRDGRCMRTRRIRSTLRANFNLRTFPFDFQTLPIQFSDAEYTSDQVHYEEKHIAGLDDAVIHDVAAWKVLPELHFEHERRGFHWDPGAPDYDYATFFLTVRRHVSFHLGKYFLPLLLIVIVAFSVFWIDPEDLASEVQVAVTCLLAAVALQLSEGSELPDVSYLTIADRAFITSYIAITFAVLQVVYTNYLTRKGHKDRAIRLDLRCRIGFPIGLFVVFLGALVRAYTQTD